MCDDAESSLYDAMHCSVYSAAHPFPVCVVVTGSWSWWIPCPVPHCCECLQVGPDCFGIMYTMTPEQAMAGVISYQRGTAEFLEHLQTSINDIRAALDHSAAP